MKLLNPEKHRRRNFLIAGILSTVLFISGLGITIANTTFGMLLNSTITYDITEEYRENSTLEFDVDEERQAVVVFELQDSQGDYTVKIDGDNGSNILDVEVPSDGLRLGIYYVPLQPDHYTVTIVAGDNAIGETPTFDIAIS